MAIAPNPLQAIIARIQGGGGSSSPSMAPQGPGAAPGQDAGPDSASVLVDRAAQLIQQAISQEKDPVERSGLAKIYALLHQFAATEQKQKDAAMGAGPAVQVLRRTAQ